MFDERFWAAGSFLVLVFFVFKPLKKMIVNALDSRSLQIQQELDKAMNLKEEAETTLVSYKRKQKEVLEEAKEILAHAEKEVARITKEAHESLEIELNRRETVALQKIAGYEARVLQDIRNNAVDNVIRAIKGLAAEHMTKEVAEKLIENSIQDISKRVH